MPRWPGSIWQVANARRVWWRPNGRRTWHVPWGMSGSWPTSRCGVAGPCANWGAWGQLERAVAVTGSVAWNLTSSFSFLALAQFHLAVGTWADSTHCIEAGMSGGRRNRDLHLSIDVRRLLAERDLLEGRPEAAR